MLNVLKKWTYTLFILLFFVVCVPTMAESIKPASLTITGIKGKVRTNVKKRLEELQQLKPLGEMSQDELRSQIIKALQPFGYYRARIEFIQINNQHASIVIYAGTQVHISSLRVELQGEGRQNAALVKTVNELPLHLNDPLLTEQYNAAKQSLLNTAENQGYLHAAFQKAEVLIDEANNTAEITLILNTGPLYFFGQIQFDPTNINPELLHRFVPFRPGQAYSTDEILKLNDNLSNSGYFSSVLVKPNITDQQTVPIAVHLQPVAKYSYTFGAGYGTDTGIRGRAGLNITPVNRRGHKFNALAQGSMVQNAIQAQYVVPGANPVNDQYSLTGNFSNLNYDTGYSNAYLLSLGQQHRVKNFQRNLSLNGLYESFNYSLQPKNNQFLMYPKATFSLSKTQSMLFSPSGYNVTLNALGANKLTFSNLSFGQLSFDAKAAITIDSLRLRLYGHTIQGITATDNINQLPLTLALLLGGNDNLKAYSFNSIGPGRIISYGGFEIQKETKKNWYIIGFYDAGDVYNPTAKNFQYDIGGGLMWVSPIGPIKIGLAQAVNYRLERASSNPRLVINMGPDL